MVTPGNRRNHRTKFTAAKFDKEKGQSNLLKRLALTSRRGACLKDGNVPIYAAPLFCALDRRLSGPVHPLRMLQDLGSFSMDLARSVTFDLIRCKFDFAHRLKIPDSCTIDRDWLEIHPGSTFGGYDKVKGWFLSHIVSPHERPSARTHPTNRHGIPKGPVGNSH